MGKATIFTVSSTSASRDLKLANVAARAVTFVGCLISWQSTSLLRVEINRLPLSLSKVLAKLQSLNKITSNTFTHDKNVNRCKLSDKINHSLTSFTFAGIIGSAILAFTYFIGASTISILVRFRPIPIPILNEHYTNISPSIIRLLEPWPHTISPSYP